MSRFTRDDARHDAPPARLRATYAAALAATADDGPAALTDAETALLREWLGRLANQT